MYCSRVLLLTSLIGLANAIHANPTFVNGLAIPGATGDSFGTSANDGRVGFFSDLYFDPIRSEWWGLSDRGPGGGTLSYDTRVQRFTLDINPGTGAISNFQIAQTIKFSNGGTAMNGLAPNPTSVLGNAFDPEGFVVHPKTGNFLVSDEYGPSLYEFDRSGQLVRAYTTPANLVPRNAGSGTPNFSGDAGNTAGKRTNRGFEGLAITPDGKYAYAMLQSAMLDEGGGSGSINRIVKFDTATGQAVAQYAYQMDGSGQGRGISALVALNDHEFLVLERNNRGVGVGADFATADKRVYKIDLTGATDVSAIDLDAPGAVYTKVTKAGTPFMDLDADTLAALGSKSPEKWEGLAIGPMLVTGDYLMLAGTDNDYSVTQNGTGTQFDVYFRFSDADPYASSIQCPLGQTTSCFLTSNIATPATLTPDYMLLPGVLHAYRASAFDLAGYVAPVPEPGTSALLLAALGALGIATRRKGGPGGAAIRRRGGE
jgi:hypothetical protein